MKTWQKYLLLVGISLLQIAFLTYPNLVLFYILANQSLMMALLAGFLLDLYSSWPFGLNMLVFIMLVYLFKYLSRKLLQPNYWYYIIISFISLGYNFLFNFLFNAFAS